VRYRGPTRIHTGAIRSLYRWSLSDAVIWDNRCLRTRDRFRWMTDVRIMRRTTTVGERIDPGVAIAPQ
jgi:alpha-ketoglutarate-dependent taurine dioxygenase